MIHTLKIDSVELNFNTQKILSDVFIHCESTKITALLGRNGQGKTSLMTIIYGTLKAQHKSIRFDERVVESAYKYKDLITYLPQFNFIPGSFKLKRVFSDFNQSFDDFKTYFPELKFNENNQIKELSGGEKRLIEVYIIIKSKAKFSLLDEPFSQLMPLHIEHITKLILQEKQRKGFLITDHLYKQCINLSDIIYLLSAGKSHLIKSINEIEKLDYANL